MSNFDADTVQRIADIEEIDVETFGQDGQRIQRTTIWVVVIDGQVYIRSVNGTRGKWWQQMTANPNAVLHVGETSYLVRAVHVDDPALLDAISEAYLWKYTEVFPQGAEWAPPMAKPETLPTTFRLEPR